MPPEETTSDHLSSCPKRRGHFRFFREKKKNLRNRLTEFGSVDLAERIDGPVLEIGCGTGLVLLPIARAGITTQWRRQSSPPMLGILRVLVDRAMVSRMVVSSAFSDWTEFSVQPGGCMVMKRWVNDCEIVGCMILKTLRERS